MTDKRLKATAVRALCGDVSDMTLWRWLQERNFPQPIYIAGRRYWKEAEILAWLESREQAPAGKAA